MTPPSCQRRKDFFSNSEYHGSTQSSDTFDGLRGGPLVARLAPVLDGTVGGREYVLLEFDAVRFLSSTMIGVLMNLYNKSKAIKGRFVIVGLRPELHKVFKIMKLEKMLQFAPTEEDGLRKLGAFRSE